VSLRRSRGGVGRRTGPKRWFGAADANQPDPMNTQVTVTVGTQCFTRAATAKID
jgi:hypothetical protein